jgi:hypothetical protein
MVTKVAAGFPTVTSQRRDAEVRPVVLKLRLYRRTACDARRRIFKLPVANVAGVGLWTCLGGGGVSCCCADHWVDKGRATYEHNQSAALLPGHYRSAGGDPWKHRLTSADRLLAGICLWLPNLHLSPLSAVNRPMTTNSEDGTPVMNRL